MGDDGPHTPGEAYPGSTVTDSTDATGGVAAHAPFHTSGMVTETPVPEPLAEQLAVLAVIAVGSPHPPTEGAHAHGGEHVTAAGGVSRKPVAPDGVTLGQAGGAEPTGPDQ